MRRFSLPILLLVTLAASAASLPTKPNDREWNLLDADYQWLQTLRKAQKVPPPTASRKQQIEITIENLNKIGPTWNAFMEKLDEYYRRTVDPRAAALIAREKLMMGDVYMNVLSRYDRALEYYRTALQFDPASVEIQQRVGLAEQRRFVSMSSFAVIKKGMKEDEVKGLVGLPREDWIKQVVQNGRTYSVWIYPKTDGGASAVYFDNGVVYHTNWNAAEPPAPAASSSK